MTMQNKEKKILNEQLKKKSIDIVEKEVAKRVEIQRKIDEIDARNRELECSKSAKERKDQLCLEIKELTRDLEREKQYDNEDKASDTDEMDSDDEDNANNSINSTSSNETPTFNEIVFKDPNDFPELTVQRNLKKNQFIKKMELEEKKKKKMEEKKKELERLEHYRNVTKRKAHISHAPPPKRVLRSSAIPAPTLSFNPLSQTPRKTIKRWPSQTDIRDTKKNFEYNGTLRPTKGFQDKYSEENRIEGVHVDSMSDGETSTSAAFLNQSSGSQDSHEVLDKNMSPSCKTPRKGMRASSMSPSSPKAHKSIPKVSPEAVKKTKRFALPLLAPQNELLVETNELSTDKDIEMPLIESLQLIEKNSVTEQTPFVEQATVDTQESSSTEEPEEEMMEIQVVNHNDEMIVADGAVKDVSVNVIFNYFFEIFFFENPLCITHLSC